MATASLRATQLKSERVFFSGMAMAMLAVVLIGFAPTYYLMRWTGSPSLDPLVHLHGIVFTAWFVLFLVQTRLIAAGRPDIHMRLGVAGVAIGIAMIVLGPAVAILARPSGPSPVPGVTAQSFLFMPLSLIALFTLFAGLGWWNRRNRDVHKRLMLLASINLLTPAIVRMARIVGPPNPMLGIVITDLFLFAAWLYDWRSRGRIHPALLWGGLFTLVTQPLRVLVAGTEAWQDLAGKLIG